MIAMNDFFRPKYITHSEFARIWSELDRVKKDKNRKVEHSLNAIFVALGMQVVREMD